ncbi:MAG: NAD(P)-dependent oxidoreductase [Bradyrhizobium sp.]|jgi:3-hydroxyisobutyrate dehydrogenase|nr:MAG: NAD(P)-dependent oxidoreductase [Bradyrhizobium sp.]
MTAYKTIGFVGLGVMGEPICRNLVRKSGARVIAFDLAREPLARLKAEGAGVAASVADLIGESEILFLCLPSAAHVRAVFEGDGILKNIRNGQIVVDLGTSSVSQTRDFARQLQAKGASWADAPIARTRQAAQDGTLSVMVGATGELFAAIEPLIRCFATDVTNCGGTGAGQVTKILNNMVLFQTVNALSEAVAVAKRNDVDPALLLATLSKGSADSFALRNHGLKAIVPGNFPERAFSTEYALKDMSYALELAADAGIKIRGAELTAGILQEAIDAGSGGAYFPVIARHLDGGEPAMIKRFPGLTPTRSRAVVHDDLVFTVAVAPDPVTSSMYEQSAKALARIDESLALCGADKSRILSAIVYITDITRKAEMNRAWDEWVDAANPPMRACIGVDLEPPHIVEIVVTAAK